MSWDSESERNLKNEHSIFRKGNITPKPKTGIPVTSGLDYDHLTKSCCTLIAADWRTNVESNIVFSSSKNLEGRLLEWILSMWQTQIGYTTFEIAPRKLGLISSSSRTLYIILRSIDSDYGGLYYLSRIRHRRAKPYLVCVLTLEYIVSSYLNIH